jgi:hypothetical protein
MKSLHFTSQFLIFINLAMLVFSVRMNETASGAPTTTKENKHVVQPVKEKEILHSELLFRY